MGIDVYTRFIVHMEVSIAHGRLVELLAQGYLGLASASPATAAQALGAAGRSGRTPTALTAVGAGRYDAEEAGCERSGW